MGVSKDKDPLRDHLARQQEGGKGKFFWFPTTDSIADTVLTIDRWSNGPWSEHNWTTEAYGSKNMEQAINYLRYGWEKVVDGLDLTDVALSIPREIQTEFERTQDVTGAQVDIASFVNCQPECMYDFMPNIKRKKTVRIFMNMSADCCGSDARIWERGKALSGCIDWLERSGYRVRLDVGDCFCGNGVTYENGWCIAFCAKDYDQALDIERISFITGSSSMLNRIFFGIESTSAMMQAQFHQTYGGCAPVPKFVRDEYDYIIEYGAPFTQAIAEDIVEQIVTGQQEKPKPIIDDSDMMWNDFETPDQMEPDPELKQQIFRGFKMLKQLGKQLEEAMEGAAKVPAGGEGEGDGGGDGQPLQLYAPPLAGIHEGYWYLVKSSPKTRARAKSDIQRYGPPPTIG